MKKLLSLFVVLGALFCAPAFAQSTSIWAPTAPSYSVTTPSASEEVGTLFNSSTPGYVVALRFWKVSADTGTHVGNLWDTNGNLLSTVTFTNETASGWQTQMLVSPIFIAAGLSYTVSRHWSVVTNNLPYVGASNIQSAPLIGVQGRIYTGTAANFPNTALGNMFFVDVVFVPGYCGIFQ